MTSDGGFSSGRRREYDFCYQFRIQPSKIFSSFTFKAYFVDTILYNLYELS